MRSLSVALLALILAGCGAGSHTTASSHAAAVTSSSKAASRVVDRAGYVARADRICRQVNRAGAPLKAQLAHMRQVSAIAGPVGRAASIEQAALARLRALPEPPADRVVLAKVWTALDRQIVDLGNVAQAAGQDELGNVAAAESAATSAQTMYRGLAQGYGFHVCGAGS